MQYKKGIIDTNIYVYAIDQLSPFHEAANKFVSHMFEKRLAVLTPQIMLDLFNVLSSQAKTESQLSKFSSIIELYYSEFIQQFVFPTEFTGLNAVRFAAKQGINKRNKLFDYYLAQTAIENGINTLYTRNVKDFIEFSQLEIINPVVVL